ncbi:hypothetical protein H5410_041272 [Solanum commersonii]|uniref:Endonuclease/exonuclease/phosphatase domain-containing protein n=1 Tax=Solanum commersonii TaxID=4109 RepID=A0A9J5XV03_SOLCO|nr:hypothetical protein H5410_041272 [Solanum commersonii]
MRKMALDKTKQVKRSTTPKSKGIGKNELKNLQSSLDKEVKILTWNVRGLNNWSTKNLVKTCLQNWKDDVICLQETKMDEMADGSRGDILLIWDNRVWRGTKVEEGSFSITYKFEALHDSSGPLLVSMPPTPERRSLTVGRK